MRRATSAFACSMVDAGLETGDTAIAEVGGVKLGAVEAERQDELRVAIEEPESWLAALR